MGEDEAFHLAVECSLATDQLAHFSGESRNEEEAEAQVQQALIASREMPMQEPYVPFKGKCVIEEDEPLNVVGEGASFSVQEVSGSSLTSFKQVPWNPPLPTPSGERVQVYL